MLLELDRDRDDDGGLDDRVRLLLREERDETGGVEDLRCVAEDVLRDELDRLEIGGVDRLRIVDGLVREEEAPRFERDRLEDVLEERVRLDEPNRLLDELRLVEVVLRVPACDPVRGRALICGCVVRELMTLRVLFPEVVAEDRVREGDVFEVVLPGD